MNQQRLARINEMAREHQLGVFEMHRIPRMFMGYVMFNAGIIGAMLAVLAFFVAISGIPFTQFLSVAGIFILPVYGAVFIFYIVIYFTDNTDVYIYTNGLVYLYRDRSGVARWEDIRQVNIRPDFRSNSTLDVYLSDGIRIKFPMYASRDSTDTDTLKKFIEERMTPSGQRF